MRKINFLLVSVFVVGSIAFTSCQPKIGNAKLSNGADSASYAIGILNGDGFRKSLEGLPGEVNVEALIAGFVETLRDENAKTKISMEEANTFVQSYFERVANEEKLKNKEEGEKFLEENKAKSGVITTESGLQYQVITEGTGERPTNTSRVKVHYTGNLLDGTTFDSSIERGEPATFPVNGVIAGWTEGLQIMPVGSKYKFWIPSELAYGEGGNYSIPGNSVLIFEVELLEIVE
ncbi:FKBP-type peptidyl-prolyl cis-trans isomerase [Parabacteroides sp. PFB2-12]|uniref:FKBP-type peptidyl-prolyl cis-trans isomerase n=1 Tax=unclassified Parabacteroides TaxID=2649774 RepID=UPI002476FE73|nr:MULTISPECIES: FKBP-type peptidyl-prolyl cis-trans isomerase [unclassified Parabacteroides]MDH6343231.1 FKBP-type peptidyl-prolyl cis-trans isomerase [Parabacteroides sp. PM6-13]MDH6390247.1 FKBP-type peptidyl-prolyl cis-trans isomerase [Parabacteroides sp. PFB2-12]